MVYTHHFTCDSKNVLYVLICNYCWVFYIGHSEDLKQRTRKHKSDVYHPENSNCKKCSNHLREHSNFREPFFQIYPILYEDNKAKRRFIEKRLLLRYKPTLNGDS